MIKERIIHVPIFLMRYSSSVISSRYDRHDATHHRRIVQAAGNTSGFTSCSLGFDFPRAIRFMRCLRISVILGSDSMSFAMAYRI